MPECLYVEVFDGYRYEGVLASGSVSLETSHNLLSILTLWALPPWSRHQKIPQLVQLFKPMFLVVPFLLHSQQTEAGWRRSLLLHLRRGISCTKAGVLETPWQQASFTFLLSVFVQLRKQLFFRKDFCLSQKISTTSKWKAKSYPP